MIFKTLHLAYRGKNLPIGRTSFRKVLTKGRSQRSPEILLPPYISISELRLMLNSDYVSCFRTAKVSIGRSKYVWTDSHGRVFENMCVCLNISSVFRNKRNVIVPYETAAYLSHYFGFKPIKVNPEPNFEEIPKTKNSIPVISVIGHNDHGKTTLIEKITGLNILNKQQPVKTQHLMATTVTNGDRFSATFLDTPGDFLFDVIRGRAIHLSDLALVVVSAEGAQLRTKDVILQADKFNVPVIFCINKIDLDYCDVELVKSELLLECNLMYESGVIKRDFRKEIENLVPVSALKGTNLKELMEVIKYNINPNLPVNSTRMEHFGGDQIKNYEKYIRRPNCLVSSGLPPKGVGFILEISKSQSFGIVLTVVVRSGALVEGNYFVAGTSFGRISGIYMAKEAISTNDKLECVEVGRSVYITGLKDLDGTTIDDLIIALPQHEAFRLSQYRKQIQVLKSSQVKGPPLNTPWATSLKTQESLYPENEPETKSEIEPEDLPEENPNYKVVDIEEHLTSIYLKPLEEDEWSARAREHNEKLKERWRKRMKVDEDQQEAKKDKVEQSGESYEKLTKEGIGNPVVPVILRANYLGTFDSILDGFELLEKEYNVRIPLVHGGIGPIVPNDIVQAEIGNKFSFCPVYAFQVPIHNDAAKHAIINKVVVKSFNLYSDLLEDVKKRCIRTLERASRDNLNRLNSLKCKISIYLPVFMSSYTPAVDQFQTMNIQYSQRTNDSENEMRWVALPRDHPLFNSGALAYYRSRLLEEWEWRSLGIRMSKGWRHCGYSPFEYNILVFKRKLNGL